MIAAILFAAAIQTTGPWNIIDERSPLTGDRSVSIGVESVEGVTNVIGQLQKPMLSVHCTANGRTVIFAWPRYFGRGDPIIAWKFDDGEIQQRSMPTGPSGRTAMFGGRAGDRFIDELAGARQVVVRAAGQDAVFDVTGAAEAVALVREACPRRSGGE